MCRLTSVLFRWFQLRREAETFFNITMNPNPCPRGGHKFYQHMELQNAKFDPINYEQQLQLAESVEDKFLYNAVVIVREDSNTIETVGKKRKKNPLLLFGAEERFHKSQRNNKNALMKIIVDDSPDFFAPVAESKYIGGNYD